MEQLGVLVIRGSGGSGFKRQERFVRKLNQRLAKKGIDTDKIVYEYIDWYEPLESRQEQLLNRMEQHPDLKLKAKMLRRFLITNITDLINYGGKPNLPDQPYEKTHLLVYNSISNLQSQVGPDAPLMILASSMGTEIINNYIWDRQHAGDDDVYGNTPLERFETLAGLFTFGSNIPIFASSTNIDDLQPIQFPIQNTASNIERLAIWENIYDKHDPLGYPIKFINTDYELAKVADIQIGVGNLLSSWNILSHFGYWTSRKIQKRVSDYIVRLFNEL